MCGPRISGAIFSIGDDLMTPAELKAERERMGLPAQWLADRWGVALNSVRRWERDRELPVELAEDMGRLAMMMESDAAGIAGMGLGEIQVPRTDADVSDGMPAAYHRAVALEAARETGARLVYG